VQAIGWWLEEANMAQVSMNLTDHDVTPIHVAYEEVCKHAAALKLPVVGSEIVGLVPLASLLQVCSPLHSTSLHPLWRTLFLASTVSHLKKCTTERSREALWFGRNLTGELPDSVRALLYPVSPIDLTVQL
jgi:hypothetical protein